MRHVILITQNALVRLAYLKEMLRRSIRTVGLVLACSGGERLSHGAFG
jgi:hypothetical protein